MLHRSHFIFISTFPAKFSPNLKFQIKNEKKKKISPQMKLTGRTIGPIIAGANAMERNRIGMPVLRLSDVAASVCVLGTASCEVRNHFCDFQKLDLVLSL